MTYHEINEHVQRRQPERKGQMETINKKIDRLRAMLAEAKASNSARAGTKP